MREGRGDVHLWSPLARAVTIVYLGFIHDLQCEMFSRTVMISGVDYAVFAGTEGLRDGGVGGGGLEINVITRIVAVRTRFSAYE